MKIWTRESTPFAPHGNLPLFDAAEAERLKTEGITAAVENNAVLRATGNWVDGDNHAEDARPMVEDRPSAEDQAQHDFMMGL